MTQLHPQHDDAEPRAAKRRKVKPLHPAVRQKHPKRATQQALEPDAEDSGFEWPDPHGYGDQLE